MSNRCSGQRFDHALKVGARLSAAVRRRERDLNPIGSVSFRGELCAQSSLSLQYWYSHFCGESRVDAICEPRLLHHDGERLMTQPLLVSRP